MIAQWAKTLATKSDDLSLIHRTHRVGRRYDLLDYKKNLGCWFWLPSLFQIGPCSPLYVKRLLGFSCLCLYFYPLLIALRHGYVPSNPDVTQVKRVKVRSWEGSMPRH